MHPQDNPLRRQDIPPLPDPLPPGEPLPSGLRPFDYAAAQYSRILYDVLTRPNMAKARAGDLERAAAQVMQELPSQKEFIARAIAGLKARGSWTSQLDEDLSRLVLGWIDQAPLGSDAKARLRASFAKTAQPRVKLERLVVELDRVPEHLAASVEMAKAGGVGAAKPGSTSLETLYACGWWFLVFWGLAAGAIWTGQALVAIVFIALAAIVLLPCWF